MLSQIHYASHISSCKYHNLLCSSQQNIYDLGSIFFFNSFSDFSNTFLFQAVKMKMDLVCKCHGVSGSCSIRICWQKMKEFRSIGAYLKEKFDGASLVQLSKKKNKLKRISKNMKKPTKKDLVYLEESPDFCEYNPKSGSLGTKGRQCIKDGYGLDGCNLMCCGRGYYTTVEDIREDCDCKFVWCCRVDCKTCTHKVEKHFCNWEVQRQF